MKLPLISREDLHRKKRCFARMTEKNFDDDNDGFNDNYGNFDDDYDKND